MNLSQRLEHLANLARRETVPAYAGDLCADVYARLGAPRRESREFAITGVCFAILSSAAAVVVWLYAGGATEATGLEAIFKNYDPLNTLAALSGV